jgi:hypothetical protein
MRERWSARDYAKSRSNDETWVIGLIMMKPSAEQSHHEHTDHHDESRNR